MYDVINGGTSYVGNSYFTIGELIALLNCHKNKRVKFLETDYTIGKLCSWRGSYDLPSISYEHDREGKLASVAAEELEQALSHIHHGWKGGEYRYSRGEEFYVAERGTSQEYKVVKAEVEGNTLVLYTKIAPY